MLRLGLLAALPLLIAATDPATETRHVVQDGETLNGIANRAQVPAGVIAAANGLVEPYDVQAGQTLTIPRQRHHTVKAGETGHAIARRYAVPFPQLAIANGLEPPYTVKTGQRLIVPAVATTPPPTPKARTEPYFRWPHDGAVLLGFSDTHDGIDIAANPLEMVRAAASGSVVFAGEEPTRFGRQVLIDHGNGWQTSYGHLSKLTVKKGDIVKTGERIGLAGDAGAAKRTELHFEIRKDGRDVDPASKLPGRRGE
ncbi:peptidoglycan DD-metalloendopeptidase family protein [Pelagerythrobacter sp.]|uniref:peptidoglycan DD-metalloendopeptidase family protein n=1 Tax=Pelagerythrobacter sp. TaxID=2800702 RepID=UPI0035AF3A54